MIEPSDDHGSENTLLRARGLHKAFGGQVVLDDVSLEIHSGDVILLHGDNGGGKTTLLNILTGNLKPDAGTIQLSRRGAERQFHFPRHWWHELNLFNGFTPERIAACGIGRTWQDVRLFTTQTLRDNIAVATPHQPGENPASVILHRPTVLAQEKLVLAASDAILANLGLKGRETSSADKISLGQSKRVAIARAVKGGAQILFLDEPLAGLDAHGITEILSLLKVLVQNRKITLIIVEHVFNIYYLLDLATSVWTLTNGKITVTSPRAFSIKGQAATLNTCSWINAVANLHSGLLDQELQNGAILSKSITDDEAGEELLQVKDLVVHRGKRVAVGKQWQDKRTEGLTFSLRRGQVAVLRAPNGWGKTTLLEAIAGLIDISSGSIQFHGKPIRNLSPWERVNKGLSLLQARTKVFPSLTVEEAFTLSHITDIPHDLDPLLKRPISSLSGGERQKIALLCAIKNTLGAVNLLDEPFASLDLSAIRYFQSFLIRHLPHTGILITVPN